jgi:dihydropyrimidinase
VDYTPYEGMELSAWPKQVLSRGELVVEDGQCLGRPGRGQFLPCLRR